MIETTINMKKKYVGMLTVFCEKHSCPRSDIVTLLLRKFLKVQPLPCVIFKRVKYQQRIAKKCWNTVHICLADDLFEKCCDIRKFCKISVSRCLALSIELFLEDIERELSGEATNSKVTDNYQHNYLCICAKDKEINIFHVYWGIPEWKEVEIQMGKREKSKNNTESI